jgi:hypothetical protein
MPWPVVSDRDAGVLALGHRTTSQQHSTEIGIIRSFEEGDMRFSCRTLLIAIAAATAAMGQGPHSSGRESLRGLCELCVVVEELGPDIKSTGVDSVAIQTDVEVKLRLASMNVVTCEKAMKSPGGPHLVANVTSVLQKGVYAVAVELGFEQSVLVEHLELRQTALVERDPNVSRIVVTTWDVGSVLISPREDVSGRVRDSIRDKVDQFINDYLAANPRK